MQINSASLLAAQQARPQATPQRTAPKSQAEDLFEPLFGKAESAGATASTKQDAPAAFARPGSQIDIRI